MTLETWFLLIFVAGVSLNILIGERVIGVIAAIAGLLYTLIVLIHQLK